MRIYTLHCEMLVKRPLKDTFAFFENPANLGRITPPWLNFKIATPDVQMHAGAKLDYVIRWLGISMKWRSLISSYDPPFSFADEQLIGPYKTWHHQHTFSEVAAGVVVADHLEYSLPLGPLGVVAHAVMVRRQLQSVFRFRQNELAKVFPGHTEELIRPEIT